MKGRKVFSAGSLILIAIASFFVSAPPANAQTSTGTWTIHISGVITSIALIGSHFSTSCTFYGSSSGTGECHISLRLESLVYGFTCSLAVNLTGWTTAPMQPSGPVGFYLNSGQVTAVAPTQKDERICLSDSFPPGTVDLSTGAFVSPVDTRVPAAPGEYTFNGYGQLPASATGNVTFVS